MPFLVRLSAFLVAHRIETKSLWFKSTWTSAARAFKRATGSASPSDAKTPRSRSSAVAHSACSPSVGVRPSTRSNAETTKAARAAAVSLSPTSLSIAVGDLRAPRQRHAAIDQGQGLLGHDRFVAAVAFLNARGVEHDQKGNAIAACVPVVDRATVDGLG